MRDLSMFGAAVVLASALAPPGTAQTYPRKPIEIIVPFVAGGTSDILARMIAQRFTESWSATVVVNNRAGGGSMIGTAAVAKSPPDGHTLLVTTIAIAINAGLQKLSFDPVKDLAPVSELTSIPLMLVVHPSVPATNLKELVVLLKANPGKWDYATSGAGTSPHLATEMFKSAAGVDMVHLPFKGNAEAMNALLGGHVKIYFAQVPAVLQHVKAGAIRARAACPTGATSRPPPSLATPATRSAPGRACSPPPARRSRSSTRSPARPSACSSRPRSASAWRARAPIRSAPRPRNSRGVTRPRSSNGRRSPRMPACRAAIEASHTPSCAARSSRLVAL